MEMASQSVWGFVGLFFGGGVPQKYTLEHTPKTIQIEGIPSIQCWLRVWGYVGKSWDG